MLPLEFQSKSDLLYKKFWCIAPLEENCKEKLRRVHSDLSIFDLPLELSRQI